MSETYKAEYAKLNCQGQIKLLCEKLSIRDRQIEMLREALEGYFGNGHEPTDGDIVHVPEHCRQCKLEVALSETEPKEPSDGQ